MPDDKDGPSGNVDLLAKAMRQVFDEEVQSPPGAKQDEDGLPKPRLLDQQGSETLDRI